MNACVMGAGAWGTAMAVHLERCGHTVTLLPRRVEHALTIASARENTDYLPGVALAPSLQIGCEMEPALMEADAAFLACPSSALGALCGRIAAARGGARRLELLVIMCKGLDPETLETPAGVVARALPDLGCAVLSGPTHAAEVAAGKPTAVVFALAAECGLDAERYQAAVSNASFRTYRSIDVRGTELGGILKNVYAIAAGMCDGLRLGDNAKAALLTRSLHEMVRVGVALGGRHETFYGLSGFGDLVATCSGEWSRNRTFGEQIAAGNDPAALISGRRTVVEGYRTTASVHRLCREREVDAPILNQVHDILYAGKHPGDALLELMTRELRKE